VLEDTIELPIEVFQTDRQQQDDVGTLVELTYRVVQVSLESYMQLTSRNLDQALQLVSLQHTEP
jgi:hypothetical protein